MANVKKVIKVSIVISFAMFTLLLAQVHEPWSDEAQSFLIARDTTIFDVFHYMKYEGTPPLWVLLIKLFLFFGGNYECLYLLPIIFSVIGLIIFEFKIKAPWYIKIIFPFTYFILYQNTIIMRSYSLVFPAFMILAVMYEKRFEKPIWYSFVLLFIMTISLHTLLVAGSLYAIFLIEMLKDKKYKNKRVVIAAIIIFFELLITALCTYPAKDCSFSGNGGEPIYHVISEATIGANLDETLEIIISIGVAILFGCMLFKSKISDVINFVILVTPIIMVLCYITYQGWHIGILWLLFFTYFIIKDKINTSIVIKIFVTCVCIVQLHWSASSYIYEIKNKYSASEDVAKFIKKLDYENLDIYGFGYSVTAIQPYFDENIFDNYCTDKAFMLWKHNNGYLGDEEFFGNEADVYVFSKLYVYEGFISERLDEKKYKIYEFDGDTYIKNETYETEGYWVYVKK